MSWAYLLQILKEKKNILPEDGQRTKLCPHLYCTNTSIQASFSIIAHFSSPLQQSLSLGEKVRESSSGMQKAGANFPVVTLPTLNQFGH